MFQERREPAEPDLAGIAGNGEAATDPVTDSQMAGVDLHGVGCEQLGWQHSGVVAGWAFREQLHRAPSRIPGALEVDDLAEARHGSSAERSESTAAGPSSAVTATPAAARPREASSARRRSRVAVSG